MFPDHKSPELVGESVVLAPLPSSSADPLRQSLFVWQREAIPWLKTAEWVAVPLRKLFRHWSIGLNCDASARRVNDRKMSVL